MHDECKFHFLLRSAYEAYVVTEFCYTRQFRQCQELCRSITARAHGELVQHTSDDCGSSCLLNIGGNK